MDPKGKQSKIGELLIAAGAIEEAQLARALREQEENDSPIGMTLVRMGFLEESTLVQVLATQLNLPVVRLKGKRIDPEVLELVPSDLAEKYRCLPLLTAGAGDSRELYLAMQDPADQAALKEVRARTEMAVKPVLVAPTELDEGLHRFYHWSTFGGEEPVSGLEESASIGGSLGGSPLTSSGDLGSPEEDLMGEPEFIDFDGHVVEGSGPLELGSSPASEDACADLTAPSQAAGANDAMLRALAQLLVEKGVITRDELIEKLQVVANQRNRD